jgi:hypothetical protein
MMGYRRTQSMVMESSPEDPGLGGTSAGGDSGCGFPHDEQNRWFNGFCCPQFVHIAGIGLRKAKYKRNPSK